MLAVMTLLSVANAGGAQEAGPARQAKPIAPLTWVTDADYPEGAIRANEQGTVSYEVQVDATGKARGCKVTGSSGSAALDEVTCRIAIERGRFDPARDEAGRPVFSTWKSRFRWVLPNGALQGPRGQPGFTLFTIDYAQDGKVSSCTGVTEAGSPVGCGLGQEPPPWTPRLAESYRRIRLQTGFQQLPSRPSEPGADWGTLIARRLSVMTFSRAEGGGLVGCRAVAEEGEPLLGPGVCSSNPVRPARPGEPVVEIIQGWALYGVPR